MKPRSTRRVLEKLNKMIDFGCVLKVSKTQKMMIQKTRIQTFSFFFLDLKLCLTDFCHNCPRTPLGGWGPDGGILIKKVNKWLTGTQFLKIFPFGFFAFLRKCHGPLYPLVVNKNTAQVRSLVFP